MLVATMETHMPLGVLQLQMDEFAQQNMDLEDVDLELTNSKCKKP